MHWVPAGQMGLNESAPQCELPVGCQNMQCDLCRNDIVENPSRRGRFNALGIRKYSL